MLILSSALLTVAANLLLRHGVLRAGGFSFNGGEFVRSLVRLLQEPAFVLGVLAYGLAALVWFKVLSVAEVSTAYPVLVGITFALVTVCAILLFHEKLSHLKLLGIAVILIGIVLVSCGSKSTAS